LSACIEMNETITARAIISHLETTKLQPDLILQTILIKTFGKLGEIKKVIDLWGKTKVIILILGSKRRNDIYIDLKTDLFFSTKQF
jgi:hypothetical protein